ncbi:MAG: trypsin-like peptidase domain-containing protein [Defluviitaleaceae bacterium]|nr:trypsin-like peptidase domain-containing protein [Defluviitaleaceae bacterium]
MDEFNIYEPVEAPETPETQKTTPPKHTGRKILLTLLIIVAGCATLGVGIGIGNAIGQNLIPEAMVEEVPTDTQITTVRVNPLAIPINPQDPSIADIIPQVKDAVVSISVLAASNRPFGIDMPGSGSGFIFYEDADSVFIATNNHVIEGAHQITISLDDNENVIAHVVGTDPASDLAVIAVSKADLAEKGVPFTVAAIGDSDIMRMGDTVLAIGNAMGEGQTVTKGIVSALDLTITVGDAGMRNRITLDVMQTDAAVNRGNSGGPLLNHHGEVIGVVTAKMMGNDIEGMGYAIPMNEAYAILRQLKESGSVLQPFIGIQHEEISEFLRDLFSLPYSGMLIRAIVPDSPAEAAGLMENDLIIYFNGVRTPGRTAFVEALLSHRPGDVVTITVFRDGDTVDIELTLGAMRH